MVRTTLFALHFRNLTGRIKDVCIGTIFYARNIHRCTPFSAHVAGSLPPPDGSTVTDCEQLINYMKNPAIKNIVVLAGAGISTPCGIPDFRTPGTGLYDNLQKYNLPTPESIFDMDYFLMDPRPFFDLARSIYPGTFKPGVAHYFVKLLEKKEKLLRMYTQNIDGLEKLAGISDEKLVEAHGTFTTASCVSCGAKYSSNEIKDKIMDKEIPICSKRARCHGVIKPNIVFFGELMPDEFFLHLADVDQADLMIIMGTSLVVHPFASVVEMVKNNVPRLMINKDAVEGLYRSNDIFEQGDIDTVIPNLVQKLGWLDDLNSIMKTGDSL